MDERHDNGEMNGNQYVLLVIKIGRSECSTSIFTALSTFEKDSLSTSSWRDEQTTTTINSQNTIIQHILAIYNRQHLSLSPCSLLNYPRLQALPPPASARPSNVISCRLGNHQRANSVDTSKKSVIVSDHVRNARKPPICVFILEILGTLAT